MMIPPTEDRRWVLARQMGVTDAIAKLAPDLTGKLPPRDAESLGSEVARYAAGGFRIVGLEGDQFDMTRIKQGLPGRDADIALYARMLQNMGRQGIGLLCLNFMVGIGWYRTQTALPCPGAAPHRSSRLYLLPCTGWAADADCGWPVFPQWAGVHGSGHCVGGG